MPKTVENIPAQAEEVANGYYAITEDVSIYRVVPNKGTWSGRKLKPVQRGRCRYVTFHYEGRRADIDVDLLAQIVFRRTAA